MQKFNSKMFFLGVLFTALLPAQAFSQEISPDEDKQRAEAIMQKALKFYQSAKPMSIQFKSKVYWASAEEWNESEGKLWLDKGGKFHLFLPDVELVSDGQDFWKYSVSNKQVTLNNAKGAEASGMSEGILFSFLKCKPISLKVVKEKGKEYYYMNLEPTETLKNYQTIEVFLNKKDYSPHQIKTTDGGENISLYTISKLKARKKFKDKHFKFKVPRKVELVDLRE